MTRAGSRDGARPGDWIGEGQAPAPARGGNRIRTGAGRCSGAASWCSGTGWPVGQLTSAAWGEAVGRAVGLGYLRHPAGDVITPEFLRAGRYQVNAGGDLYPATVSLRPPFDPGPARRVRAAR